MTIEQAYNDWATTYDHDRNRTRDLDAEVTKQVLAGRRYSRVLEIGCGTGKNTALLAELADEVFALDFSPGMLAQARAKAWPSHVRFEEADLTQPWPGADRRFDMVVANLVLEHIADLDFILSEVARVLASGGSFFLCELHPFRQYQGTVANFQCEHVVTPIAAYVHHVSDYVGAAARHGLAVERLNEWWHAEDVGLPPRLLSIVFRPIAR